ncbi:MAG: tetratricopeptide repeat protein [Azospirillaceae bacterium]
MSDIFREVDEALKEDRVKAFWKRYGNLLITCALLVVLATAAFVWWRGEQQSARLEAATNLINALGTAQESADGGLAALSDVAESSDDDVAALARLGAASVAMENGDAATALSLLDQVANDSAVDRLLRDAATLRSVYYRLDDGEVETLRGILGNYTGAGSPWRPWALEMEAMLLVRTGNTEQARDILQALAGDEDAPAAVADRAAELAAALDE